MAALATDRRRGLAKTEAAARRRRYGANAVPEPKAHPVLRFLGKFWGLSAWMIELIAALSAFLGKWTDFWIALALLLLNAVLSFLQEQRAATAIAALRHRLQVGARVLRDGIWQALPAQVLVPGDIVRVRAGDFIPADAQVIDGTLQVDQSALTGESAAIDKAGNDPLYSGTTVSRGEATAVVTAIGAQTGFGRTTQLVQSARPRPHVEAIVTRLVAWLFAIVGAFVAVTVAASLARGSPLLDILPLSLVLLMSAVPVALPAMLTVSMAVGAMMLARQGVLVTRLNAAEDAANMDVLCADKTGTLTMNRPSVVDTRPQPGFEAADVLRAGALASHEADQDPIDVAFLRAARERRLLADGIRLLAFTPFSPQTRHTEALIADEHGRRLRLAKGALGSIAALCGLAPDALTALEDAAHAAARQGFRVLAVARAEAEAPLQLVGLALLRDTLRADSLQLVSELQGLGVGVRLLTGDALPVAQTVAAELGLGNIRRAPELRAAEAQDDSGMAAAVLARESGGFAEVFPDDKFLIVKSLQAAGHVVGMTGDGINDAPALRQAEVGIAVRGATDIAKGAASMVLTDEGLAGIVTLVKNGRAIYQRVLTWIINKISRTILKAGFVVIAFLVTGKFVISALGMVLIVFMTDFVKLALSTDRVRPSNKPESWHINPLIGVAVLIGLLMLIEALGLLALGWHRFGLDAADGRLRTFTFQTLLFFALFSILSIREREAFWRSWPSGLLMAALLVDAAAGLAIGLRGLAELRPLPPVQTALIVAFALVCTLFNDLIKTACIAWLRRRTPAGKAAVGGRKIAG